MLFFYVSCNQHALSQVVCHLKFCNRNFSVKNSFYPSFKYFSGSTIELWKESDHSSGRSWSNWGKRTFFILDKLQKSSLSRQAAFETLVVNFSQCWPSSKSCPSPVIWHQETFQKRIFRIKISVLKKFFFFRLPDSLLEPSFKTLCTGWFWQGLFFFKHIVLFFEKCLSTPGSTCQLLLAKGLMAI